MFLPQTPTPFMVEIIRPPAEEQTIADVLVNSLGLAGALAVAAIPLGLVVGYLLIKWNARRPPEADHMPHVSPSVELTDGPLSHPVKGPPSAPVP
ncbi:MAG TPA: hypothetical protein VMZ90_13075 [Vicinamibacterales bacterium]|nr:hypothetical protein [Vicinamibacterales bacterium]